MTISALYTGETTGNAVWRVRAALDELLAGRPIVVLDDEDREDEADLIFAAECATPSLVAFTVRHTTGFLCTAITEQRADELRIPPMSVRNDDRHGTAYAVTADAKRDVTTGISAADRARTLAVLSAPESTSDDIVRPGHVAPLRARAGGVLERRGHTEAAMDLTALAGLRPAGALCELVSRHDPTRIARGDEARAFAREYGLHVISVEDVASYCMQQEHIVERCADARLPLSAGEFRAIGYRNRFDGLEHVALVRGRPGDPTAAVHVHRECTVSGVLGRSPCGCRQALEASLEAVSREGDGVVVYLRAGSRLGSCGALGERAQPASNAIVEAIRSDLAAMSNGLEAALNAAESR